MHRFYAPPDHCGGDLITLDGGEARHAALVLRVRPGERVGVLDGAGQELGCEVTACVGHRVSLKVRERKAHPKPSYRVTLLQAIPKGKLLEAVIQKATELGVARIVPLLTERVITHLDPHGAEAKAEKWRGVAVEAIKQCGCPWLPQIETPIIPSEFIARQESFDLQLVASLRPGSRHPREHFAAFATRAGRKPGSVAVWIGPEGDFTAGEYELIERVGALAMTLGRLVLRTETAAIYCLSICNYELTSPA